MQKLQLLSAIVGGLLMSPILSQSQWLKYRSASVPRTPDGRPDLNAPVPKTADGHSDISGLWQLPMPPVYLSNIAKDLKPEEVSMLPWAEALYKQRRETESKDDPSGYCVPGGVPRSYLPPYPFKILSLPGEVIILFEAIQSYRQIFSDGRELPKDPNPTWMGYSIGKWDGDAFVIQSTGFKDQGWIDNNGHPSSDSLRVTERLRRKDVGHMDVQITIDDSKTYAKPWTVTLPLTLVPEGELLEYICSENNKDVPHLVGK